MPLIVGDIGQYHIISPPKSTQDFLEKYRIGTGDGSGGFQQNVPTQTAVQNVSSGGGGGGGYYYGGSGGGASYPSSTMRGWFQDYYGSTPDALVRKADEENWTMLDVIRRAIADGVEGPQLTVIKGVIRQTAAPFYWKDPAGIPESLVIELVKKGYFDGAGVEYLQNIYFPSIKEANLNNPLATPFVDAWVEMTGRPLTTTALNKLQEIVRTFGYTEAGKVAWQEWVKTTDSAITGNWGAAHRAGIYNDITTILGRLPVAGELDPDSALWNMSDAARLEYLRTTPEYQDIYAGKPVWMSELDFVSFSMAYDEVFRWYYGDTVIKNEDGSLTIPYGPYEGTQEVPVSTPVAVTPTWQSLSAAQFKTDLQKLGFNVSGEGGDVSQWVYTIGGETVAYDALAAKLEEVAPDTYYRDEAGFHYVQYEGVANPKTGQVAPVTKPVPTTFEDTASFQGLSAWTGGYVTSQMVSDLLAGNISPANLKQMFIWQEEAIYLEGAYSDTLTEAFGSAGDIDWYKLASGAEGSGAMRVQLMQAQNRIAFREAWRNYFNTDPTPADYDYLTNNFVSPAEFTHRMAAKESAKANFDKINELLNRTMGMNVTLDELENLAMGGSGSGSLQAMIEEATRLDAYTDVLYQWTGGPPTPDDYAGVAGFPSASAFKWEITVAEQMDELGPDIMSTWMKAYPDNPLTEEQLKIMIGKSEGWGELQYLYNQALEEEQESEYSRKIAMDIDKVRSIYQSSSIGGIKEGLPGLGDIGA